MCFRRHSLPRNGWTSLVRKVGTTLSRNYRPSLRGISNPVSDHSLINFKKSYKDITISVYNSFGQFLVKKSSSNSRYVELRNLTLSSGIYLLSVTCDNVYLGTKKVIVE